VFEVNHPPYFEVLEVSDIIYNDAPINLDELLSEHPLSSPVSYDNISAGATAKVAVASKISMCLKIRISFNYSGR
jgi:hypothetical protein